jgi:cobalamin biosynthesis protein CobT
VDNIYGDGTQGMSDDAKDNKVKRDLADDVRRDQEQRGTSSYTHAPYLNGTRPNWKDGSYTFGLNHYKDAASKMAPMIMMLSRRLGMVLANNAQEAYQTGHRRGALHARKTYKVKMGNPRVFRQRKAIGEKNYVVGLLLDTSSSMQGEMGRAREMVVMLAESLSKAGIGMFMIPWSTQPTGIWRTGDKLDEIAKGFLAGASTAHGGTYEAPALIMALDEFKKSPEATKIMLTITDGDTIAKHESIEVLAELKKVGAYDICIEVGSGNGDQHAHRIRVRDVNELVVELPKILGSLIRKGA